MNALLVASIGVLFAIFSIIMGFVFKLWLDERNMARRREAVETMCIDGAEKTEETGHRRRRHVVNRTVDENLDEEEAVREQELPSFPTTDEPKIGKKKLAKLQAKAEAKVHREQEQAERQERKKQEEIKQKQEELDRLEKETEEQKKRDKLKVEREESKRREMEEYQKLKETFTLDDQGFDEMDQEQTENLLKAFIDHIKQKKVVHVDELASHFSLSSEDVVNRLETFMSEKLITGVFDDRGKFIYITDEELRSVARFINQRGRVSVLELVDYSNRLISLETA